MIDIEQARQILDLAGGSIRYWATDIVDERATKNDPQQGISVGDILSLSFTDPTRSLRYRVTPEQLQQHALGHGVEINEDMADQFLQLTVFDAVLFNEVEMTPQERKTLDQQLRGMRVEEE